MELMRTPEPFPQRECRNGFISPIFIKGANAGTAAGSAGRQCQAGRQWGVSARSDIRTGALSINEPVPRLSFGQSRFHLINLKVRIRSNSRINMHQGIGSRV